MTEACVIATRPVSRGGNPSGSSDKRQHLFREPPELPLLVVARWAERDRFCAALTQGADMVDALLRRAEGRPVSHHGFVEDGSVVGVQELLGLLVAGLFVLVDVDVVVFD